MAERVRCADCGETLHQVPGGSGPVWVNPAGFAACLAGDKPHPHRVETDEELLERMKSMTLKEAKAHVRRKAQELEES